MTLPPGPWLMEPSELRRLLAAVAARGPDPRAAAGGGGGDRDGEGGPDPPRKPYEIRRGVAVLPLAGPIYPRMSVPWVRDLYEYGAATPLDRFRAAFDAALADPAARAILLDVDSPGGYVAGISEMAAAVHAARGAKPIGAYARYHMTSAAYWIGTAASTVVAEPTAALGSIGVVRVAVDESEFLTKLGIRTKVIVSDQSPNKWPDPFTEAGELQARREINEVAALFVEAVARHRGTDEATVLSDFGGGETFHAAEAVDLGMADRVGTFDDALAELAEASRPKSVVRFVPARAAAATGPRVRFGVH